MKPYNVETNVSDPPATRIADLEHRLTSWLAKSPEVLSALITVCRGDCQLAHVAKTVARMVTLHKEFALDEAEFDTFWDDWQAQQTA